MAWKVSAVRVAREANLQILKALRICFNLGAADTKCLLSKPSFSRTLQVVLARDTHAHILSEVFSLCRYGLGRVIGPLASTDKSTFHFYLDMQLFCFALKSVGCFSLDSVSFRKSG